LGVDLLGESAHGQLEVERIAVTGLARSRVDQLARNLEAAWITGAEKRKNFCVLLCHETVLSSEEQSLVEGYRSGELIAGLPHLEESTRLEFKKRIGTLTWREIVEAWPALRADPLLVHC
jgi:hypothetical protein